MRTHDLRTFGLALLVAASTTACNHEQAMPPGTPLASPPESTKHAHHDVATPASNNTSASGQTIYVPVYSQVAIGEKGRLFDLAVTLSVRNTDRARPITLSHVRFYRSDGQLIRDSLEKPARIAPMAARDFFVRERDASGGASASFLVEWSADHAVSSPVVVAVMVGTTSNQGVSFTTQGRVVDTPAP